MLFIDEIHTVIGAGATSGGAMDASNLLKPALQGGKLRCMGSTTYKEFRQHYMTVDHKKWHPLICLTIENGFIVFSLYLHWTFQEASFLAQNSSLQKLNGVI